MVTELAIRAEGIGKEYRIPPKWSGAWKTSVGSGRHRFPFASYQTLREAMSEALAVSVDRMGRRFRGGARTEPEEHRFWALRDVSFEIKPGEVVAIIGRNGAGKTTLLKILSRVTEPTEGAAEIRGRVGSLLEVGTGFHPELTGRENVYLYGAILGMRRNEVRRKFDEIVAFAEVESFIDTPVKFYSSGMYLRLAFAVAAFLEPEILIADEVLAVGDARFQKKCLATMHDMGRTGRTVVFVSHNMPTVTRLCQRAILLEGGRVIADGPARRVVSGYMTSSVGARASREWVEAERPGGEIARLIAVRVRGEDGHLTDHMDIRRPVDLEMEFEVIRPGYALMPSFHLRNEEGIEVFSAHDLDPEWRRRPRGGGIYVSIARIPGDLLAEGTMFVGAGLTTVEPDIPQFFEFDVAAFQVIDSTDGDSARGDFAGNMTGVVRPRLAWRTLHGPARSATLSETSRVKS